MPPRDPDSRFEQALARHLQRGAAPPGCLEAETLASYHEGVLTPGETAACKTHLAACARCQEVLGALEASDAVPAHNEEYALAAAAAPAVAAAPRDTAHGSRERRRVKGGAKTKPPWLQGWLVPVTVAVAAGIVIWMGVRETRHSAQAPVQVAMNSPASKPTEAISRAEEAPPPAAMPAAPPAPKKAARLYAPTPSLGVEGRAVGRAAATPQSAPGRIAPEISSAARPRLVPESADVEKDQRSSGALAKLQGPAAVAAGEAPAPAPPPLLAGRVAADYESKQVKREPASVSAVVDSAQLGDAQRADGLKAKRAPGQEQAKQDVVANAPASASERVAAQSLRGRRVDELKKAATGTVSPLRIAAPRGRVLWRAGDGGQIEKSSDGGASWTQQWSGVAAGVLAGAAPSEQVCWLVGRGGTVLRTTDGDHWTRISFPFAVDLGGVTSSDALHALVWDMQNKVHYSTSDGGNTWKRIEGKQ